MSTTSVMSGWKRRSVPLGDSVSKARVGMSATSIVADSQFQYTFSVEAKSIPQLLYQR